MFVSSSIEEISERLEYLSASCELQSTSKSNSNGENSSEQGECVSTPSTSIPESLTPDNEDDDESDKEEEIVLLTKTTVTPLDSIAFAPKDARNEEVEFCTQIDAYASPKTQHFSREFVVFLTQKDTSTSTSTSIAVGQAQARYIDRSRLNLNL